MITDARELDEVAARHGITKQELCRQAGVALSTFYRMRRPNAGYQKRTIEALNAALESLVAERLRGHKRAAA